MLPALICIIVLVILLLFFWPHRLEGYYSGEGWFIEWRAYFFKSYFSPNGSSHSFLKWKLKDSTEGEEESLTDELFEDPDFEPELHHTSVVSSEGDSTVRLEDTKTKAANDLPKEVVRTKEKPKKKSSPVAAPSLEERVERKVETFFEQPKSVESDWNQRDEEQDKKENWLSPTFIKAKIEEWKELWQEYRKDIIKLLKWCKLFLIYSLKVIKPTICQVSLHGGFDNPADTGHFYAWFTNTFSFLPTYSWLFMHYTPHYGDDKEWTLDAKLLYKFNLLQFLAVTLLVVVTFPYFAYKRVKRKYYGEDELEVVGESA